VTTSARRPTIVDVGHRARVSVATVSRVLAGRPVADQELVARVRAAATELGYRPNTVARGFRLGRTGSIGVVVPDLANPFFPHVLKGLANDVSAGEHRLLVVDSGEDPEEEIRLVEQLAGRCDGILLCSPRMSVANLRAAAGLGLPVICTNRSVEGLPLGTIGIDSATGMRQAVGHLHELGHRRIGYLAGPESSWSDQRRREGLAAAAAALGVNVHITETGSTSDAGFAALPDLLRLGVTAVVAFNDLVAVGALSRLRELDVAVPGDLSVVGFDDIPVAAFLGPPLTTVNVPKEELGRQAWAMLHRQMQDGKIAAEQWLPSSLVVRRSTAPPSV